MGFAHFLQTFPQPGGTATAVRGLVDAGHRVGRRDEILSYGETAMDARKSSVRPLNRFSMSAPVPLPLPDEVAGRLAEIPDLDALVLHGVFTPSCSRLSIVARRHHPQVAVVAYPQDAYDAGLFSTRTTMKRVYWTAVERPYLRRADLVVVSAPSHAELLWDAGVRTPTLVVALGLSPDECARALAAKAARRPRAEGAPLRLLMLGRWDIHEKGIDLLCAAASDITLRRQVTVRLVGPPYGARSEVEALIGRYAPGNFRLVGYVDDIWAEISAADALVLPSRKEGFGLVALQALVSGMPVVLSTSAGIAEHVDGGLIRVAPDVTALRAGLYDLVARYDELSRQAAAGSALIAGHFTWSRVLEQLEAALENVRSGRGQGV